MKKISCLFLVTFLFILHSVTSITVIEEIQPVYAAPLFPIKNNLYDDIVFVKQFGAKGDGNHDDTKAIQDALDSGASTIIFEPGEYRLSSYLVFNKDDVTIQGNGATLFTDNRYRNRTQFFEWLVLIQADHITMNDLNIEARESIKVGYKTQLGICHSTDVSINQCNFIIPSTVLSDASDRNVEYTNMDLYSDWHDITVKECVFKNFADSEAGSCLIARDLLGQPSDGLVFKNNTCSKITHDEIIFVTGQGGTVKDVKILNNTLTMKEKTSSPSDICISLGTADAISTDNVIFKNNKINFRSAYAMMTFGNSTNVHVTNNTIKYTKSGSKAGGVVFTQGDKVDNIRITKNKITIKNISSHTICSFNDANTSFIQNKIVIKCSFSNPLFAFKTVSVRNNTVSIPDPTIKKSLILYSTQ